MTSQTPDAWIYVGNCPICQCGLRRVRVCEGNQASQAVHGYIMCDDCETLWLEPSINSPRSFPDSESPACPVCQAPLFGPHARWANLSDVQLLGWHNQCTIEVDVEVGRNKRSAVTAAEPTVSPTENHFHAPPEMSPPWQPHPQPITQTFGPSAWKAEHLWMTSWILTIWFWIWIRRNRWLCIIMTTTAITNYPEINWMRWPRNWIEPTRNPSPSPVVNLNRTFKIRLVAKTCFPLLSADVSLSRWAFFQRSTSGFCLRKPLISKSSSLKSSGR